MSSFCLPNVYGFAEIFGLIVAAIGVLSTTLALRSLRTKIKTKLSDADEYVIACINAERHICSIMFWNFGLAYWFSIAHWTVALTYGIGFALLAVGFFLHFAATIESCIALIGIPPYFYLLWWRRITGRGNAKNIILLTYTFFGIVYVVFPLLGWSCADADMCRCIGNTHGFFTLACADAHCSQLFPPLRHSYVLSPISVYSVTGLLALHMLSLIQRSQKSDANTDSLKSMWLYTLLSSLPLSLLIAYDSLMWFNANPPSFWTQDSVVGENEIRFGLEDAGNFVSWGKFLVAISVSRVMVSSYYIGKRYTPFKENIN